MVVRQRIIAASSLRTSQLWLKVGEFYYLLDDPAPGETAEGPTPLDTVLSAFVS